MMKASDTSSIQLLNAKDAAKLLAISERTLWTLTKNATIPSIKLGRSTRYRVSDLEMALSRLCQRKEN